jgi:nitrogen fixation protein FixH
MTRHWHWGTKIALTYGLFATGTLTMVGIAVSQRTDLVAPDYYARALRQDERAAALANTAALGTAFAITADDDGQLVVRWPHQPDAGAVVLYRPSNADADRTLALAATAVGTGAEQHVPLGNLQHGLWRIQVTWVWQGRPYYAEEDVVVR